MITILSITLEKNHESRIYARLFPLRMLLRGERVARIHNAVILTSFYCGSRLTPLGKCVYAEICFHRVSIHIYCFVVIVRRGSSQCGASRK